MEAETKVACSVEEVVMVVVEELEEVEVEVPEGRAFYLPLARIATTTQTLTAAIISLFLIKDYIHIRQLRARYQVSG